MVSKITLVLVSTVTVGAGGATSIEFTGIPATATNLYVTMSLKASSGSGWLWFRFNSDTGANYSSRSLYGDGSTAYSQSWTGNDKLWTQNIYPSSAAQWGNTALYMPNYTSSNAKSVSIDGNMENNGSYAIQGIFAGLWSGTSAVTSLTIIPDGTMAQYSTASLYTITKGSGGATVS
jgi:hypothetical protein